jgi:ribosomal protein S18 acetylase RimI-like enzyme
VAEVVVKPCYIDKSTRSIADLDECVGGAVITRINVPVLFRCRGLGRLLLGRILLDADAEHVTLFLEICPSDGLDYNQLAAWYERHGFVEQPSGLFRRLPCS